MEEGFGALAAAQAALAGEAIERCIDAAAETLRRTRYLFTPHTLEYLRRGGRIGGASAMIGSLLQIRPILTVEDGETQEFAKVRTQSKALAEIARKFADDIAAFGLADVIVHYIHDRELAERYANEQIAPLAGGRPIRVIPVSPVIGLHVGPAIGVVYTTERDWA
jgi:DegV family protein with EDD domain